MIFLEITAILDVIFVGMRSQQTCDLARGEVHLFFICLF